MSEATEGDKVRVHYTGKLEDGRVFDSSRDDDRDPLEFTLGDEQVIPGFEEAVEGLTPGESTSARLEPDEAYGPRRDELIFQIDRSQFKEASHLPEPEVGQRLQLRQGEEEMQVTIQEVGDEKVTLDANHPLAGQPLLFDIELLEIE